LIKVNYENNRLLEKFGDDPAKRPPPGRKVKKGENYEKVRRPALLINYIKA
jgi:hypothetical protein